MDDKEGHPIRNVDTVILVQIALEVWVSPSSKLRVLHLIKELTLLVR